jgi:rhodanese-related sulfurtransferase
MGRSSLRDTLTWVPNANGLCCNLVAVGASQEIRTSHPEAVVRGWVKVLLVMILIPIVLGGVVLLFAGRPLAFQILRWRIAERFPEVQWISTEELARWRADTIRPQPVILDARTEPEFQVSHIAGARQIDPYRPSIKPLQRSPRDTAIVVYSSVGYRSAGVASWLEKQGYTRIRNLEGSIFQWANEGRLMLKEENRPTAVVHPYDQRWGYLVKAEFRARAPDAHKQSAAP